MKWKLTIKVVLKTVGRASTTYNTLSYRTGILFWTRSIWILPKYPTRPRLFDSTTRKLNVKSACFITAIGKDLFSKPAGMECV